MNYGLGVDIETILLSPSPHVTIDCKQRRYIYIYLFISFLYTAAPFLFDDTKHVDLNNIKSG